MAARLPAGIAAKTRAIGAFLHKGRNIEAPSCANAADMRARVRRKRFPFSVAVIGPSGSGKTSLINALAQSMGAGVPDACKPTQTGTGLNTTIVYSRHLSIALIDTPGDPAKRRDVITALAQSDAVILVVDSDPTKFKESIPEWQEYVKLIHAMDRDWHFMTVINKLDQAPADVALSRFMQARMPMQRYFEKVLYGSTAADRSALRALRRKMGKIVSPVQNAKNRIFYTSATTGVGVSEEWRGGAQNVLTLMDKLGGTLVRFLNGFGTSKKGGADFSLTKDFFDKTKQYYDSQSKAPLRILIDDVFYNETGGWVAVGKIASGSINVGDEVVIAPGGVSTTAKEIKFQNADPSAPNFNVKRAVAGERVEITIGESGISANMIFAGSVMGSLAASDVDADAPATVTEIEAQVSILEDAKDWNITVKKLAVGALFRGEETTEQPFDFALGAYPAYFEKILATVNPNTGKEIKKGPETVTKGQTAKVMVRLSGEGIPLDTYQQFKDTGRFLVRDSEGQGRLVAVGKITSKEWM